MKSKKKKSEYKEDGQPPLIVSEPIGYYYAPSFFPAKSQSLSDMDILKVIKRGISKKELDNTMLMMDFSLDDMAALLHISSRTFRRFTDDSFLNTEQSERIVELNKLYQYGVEVFGSLSKFRRWIDSEVIALGNKKPREFLDTSLGISILKTILGRIEYGVYS
ncbi:MAG TPA: DUF2384 domain-containing protein [Niabella sp.]|nr:DUF2384 domain-containing protein [Chitinophagaceae bacterium]HRN47436.1 DUF2384 domain-containing protein [Niabella sp.]HRO83402.1 DUF2384 domain-containing protein [Niabella sp.]